MFLLRWSEADLAWMVLGAAAVVGCVALTVPSANRRSRRSWTESEITVYDDHVPRYFLVAAVALVTGGIHMVVKNFPPFSQWLWEAGYGGHLFRDLANSHIIIVGGGTVMLTGLTWYLLPRAVGRPLYSHPLASASLWFTVIGVFGFYLSWLVLGLVEGSMIRDGMTYEAAKASLGPWHRIPTRLTSSIMGVGYWTYVLNVALTVWAGRSVESPHRRLIKFLAVPAAALFVGTVQGVLQVLPDNASWIHAAGEWGQYVDPISHAHINLVTGMVVALVGFAAYTNGAGSGRAIDTTFWALTGTSVLFYLAFLGLGMILGGAELGHGGLQWPAAANWLLPRATSVIAITGTLMLAGFWVYFAFVLRVVWPSVGDRRTLLARPAGFWLASTAALAVGTAQGIGQVFPATARYLTAAEELPNVHAQLNMIGGVLLALIGTGFVVLPRILGVEIPAAQIRRTLIGVGGGMTLSYLATLWHGAARARLLLDGATDGEASAAIGWWPSAAMTVAALVVLGGFVSFARGVWAATDAYRSRWKAQVHHMPTRVSGPFPSRLRQTPTVLIVGLEFVAGLLGWPGPGWLYAGKAIPGVTLLLAGPALSWAVLPMLFSPYGNTFLSSYGWTILLIWLPATAAISAGALAIELVRTHHHRLAAPAPSTPVEQAPSTPVEPVGAPAGG